MRRTATMLAVLAAACTVEVDERDVFAPQAKVPSWGDQPNDGIAGERYLADPTDYPFAEHGLRAHVRHAVTDGVQTSLVSLAQSDAAGRPLIVHCFGNGSDRWRTGLKYGHKVLPYGDVLLFDYPGYNGAAGEPTPAAFERQADVLAAHVQGAYRDRPRAYWGHSLGGFVCAEVAARDAEAAALILETTAPDVRAAADAWVPWYARPFVRLRIADSLMAYDTPRTAAGVDAPVLVIGAGRDDVLPVRLSRQLRDRLEALGADVTYRELPEAGHFDTSAQEGFDPAVRAFLSGAL